MILGRSAAEIRFRLKQEFYNLGFYLHAPDARLDSPRGPELLPDPSEVAGLLRSTEYARQIERIAEKILRHEFPMLGTEIHTGPEIHWRRDYVHGRETGLSYFRRIPYLDARRAGDHKIIWELNRHQHLVLLAQTSLLTGRSEFQTEIVAEIESWLVQNPFQRGINWASALEVAFRALSWIWIDHLVGPNLQSEFRRRFLRALYHHGLHLERNLSIYFSPNTHVLGEAVALHALGAVYPAFPRAATWQQTGRELVLDQMHRQIRNDGSHFEQSAYYHIYAFDMFLFHAVLTTPSPEYLRRLASMADYLDCLLGTIRRLPLIGDDDGGRFFHPYGDRDCFGRASLATASVLLNRPWQRDRNDLCEQAAWWIGTKALRTAPIDPPDERVSRLFPDSGCAVMTSGGVQICIDAGPFGPGTAGHSHSDTLAMIVRSGEKEILVDSGTYTYVGDPQWRDRFRGSAAHNTIRIDGRDQAMTRGPFGWSEKPRVELKEWSSNAAEDTLRAVCRYGDFIHTRWIRFQKPVTLEISDEIDGPPGQHTIEQFWHCGETTIELGATSFAIGGVAVLELDTALKSELSEGGEFGWLSRTLGSKEPAPVIRGLIQSPLPLRLKSRLTFVCPG